MPQDNSRADSLAVEISAAVFRVAALVRHKRLREELEEAAIELVKFLKEESASRLERLILLGEAIEEINEINAEVLLRELVNWKLEFFADPESEEPVLLGQDGQLFGQHGQHGQLFRRKWPRTEERHAAILDFVRRFPDYCSVESLFLEFAFVSRRTLRRDLEELARRGALKRRGDLLIHAD
ncbi:MAG: DeoR family transcriptional regulator [Candidatus Colwellbacteria bacterium]|nr:DeoR family transcriptional regulator [Candidatus Colwellbacteria bacterium]